MGRVIPSTHADTHRPVGTLGPDDPGGSDPIVLPDSAGSTEVYTQDSILVYEAVTDPPIDDGHGGTAVSGLARWFVSGYPTHTNGQAVRGNLWFVVVDAEGFSGGHPFFIAPTGLADPIGVGPYFYNSPDNVVGFGKIVDDSTGNVEFVSLVFSANHALFNLQLSNGDLVDSVTPWTWAADDYFTGHYLDCVRLTGGWD